MEHETQSQTCMQIHNKLLGFWSRYVYLLVFCDHRYIVANPKRLKRSRSRILNKKHQREMNNCTSVHTQQ